MSPVIGSFPLERLLSVSGVPSVFHPMLLDTITPARFVESGGFLVAEFLNAVTARMRVWELDTLLPPTVVDDAGWRRAVDSGFRSKVWITKHDDRVRKLHDQRHKEERPIWERFSIQAGTIGPMYPRDPVVIFSDRVNCRCRLAFLI